MNRAVPLLILAVACTVHAQQLDVKAGAWEVTTSGGPLPRPSVEKECMTKADIAQFSAGPDKDEDSDCKVDKAPTITGKTWSAEKTCPGGRKMRAEFTADTPERVKGAITITQGGKTTTVQISAKWLGASCKGID